MTAEELNQLLNAITNTGYKITDVLSRHIDADDMTDEQGQALRTAAAFLSAANSVIWEQYMQVKE